jgi:hypothetical protein
MATDNKTTQEFVPIKEVRDGIVVLKDNGMRAVVMASSLNFALKSADEQNSIIFQFQNFLNSLDFSIQIFIQSRRLNIEPYLGLLEERYKDQPTELMKIQTREYIEFIRTFTENTNIMSKSFFVVIPYSPPVIDTKKNPFEKLLKKTPQAAAEDKSKVFEENRSQLDQRVSVVTQGLARCGIKCAQLGTEEIVELYYKIFNPDETNRSIQIN